MEVKKLKVLYLFSAVIFLFAGCSNLLDQLEDDIRDHHGINTHELTLVATDGGSVEPSSVTLRDNEEREITATASSGYYFQQWEMVDGDGILDIDDSTSAVTTVSIAQGDVTLQAVFSPWNILSVIAGNGGTITLPESSPVTVGDGQPFPISASADSGYEFLNWVNNTSTTDVVFDDSSSAVTNVTVTGGDAEIEALFIQASYNLTVVVNSLGNETIVEPVGGNAVLSPGVPFDIEASTPDVGNQFTGWSKSSGVGNADFADSTSLSTTVTVTGGDVTIQANFSDVVYSLSVSAGTGGSIIAPASSPVDLSPGQELPIEASADTGFSFSQWNVTAGGGSINIEASNLAATTVSATGNGAIEAQFLDIQDPTGSISISDISGYSQENVSMTLSYSDNVSVTQMKISDSHFNKGTSTGWISSDTNHIYNFSGDGSDDGSQTLFIRFKDAAGNESAIYSDVVIVDATAPTFTDFQVHRSSGDSTDTVYLISELNLELEYAGSDTGSGVKGFHFSNTNSLGSADYVDDGVNGNKYSWDLSSSNKDYYDIYYWIEDNVGNVSASSSREVRLDDTFEGYFGNNSVDTSPHIPYQITDNLSSRLWAIDDYGYSRDVDVYRWEFTQDIGNTNVINSASLNLIMDYSGSTLDTLYTVNFYEENSSTSLTPASSTYNGSNTLTYTFDSLGFDISESDSNFFMEIIQIGGTAPYTTGYRYDVLWTFTEEAP